MNGITAVWAPAAQRLEGFSRRGEGYTSPAAMAVDLGLLRRYGVVSHPYWRGIAAAVSLAIEAEEAEWRARRAIKARRHAANQAANAEANRARAKGFGAGRKGGGGGR